MWISLHILYLILSGLYFSLIFSVCLIFLYAKLTVKCYNTLIALTAFAYVTPERKARTKTTIYSLLPWIRIRFIKALYQCARHLESIFLFVFFIFYSVSFILSEWACTKHKIQTNNLTNKYTVIYTYTHLHVLFYSLINKTRTFRGLESKN